MAVDLLFGVPANFAMLETCLGRRLRQRSSMVGSTPGMPDVIAAVPLDIALVSFEC